MKGLSILYIHPISVIYFRSFMLSSGKGSFEKKKNYCELELWVNFDQIYCFWAYFGLETYHWWDVSPISVCLSVTGYVSPISVRLSVTVLCYVSPISVRLSVTVLCYVSPISVRLSVTGISNRQTDGKSQRGTELTD